MADVKDLRASGSTTKGKLAVDDWDILNESALVTIQLLAKPNHVRSVTAVGTTKKAQDILSDQGLSDPALLAGIRT